MTVTSMALPVDIPWERWCVSEDMIDKKVCDSDRPAKWQSSIAVFRYVPDDDYQIYANKKITYIKVVCTVSGFQPKADEVQGILSTLAALTITPFTQEELDRRLSSYVPCNEALVQVSVGPLEGAKISLEDYPYFMDFQPKKREMIETATDTSEFMSRSLDSLNINKSGGSTQSQEVLDIDQGFNVGASSNFQYAGTGGGGSFNYAKQGQWGTKQLGGNQSALVRTSDESHERRETQSHTTQTTQLRHLLDSYHLGTNRAVFFIQPRPNVLQAPSGIVGDSPRYIEGIQEFFLIVNQPKHTRDFCVDVRLDTGHLIEKPVMAYKFRTDTPPPVTFANPTLLPEDTDLVNDGTTRNPLRHDDAFFFTYDASLKYDCKKRTSTNSEPAYTPATVDGVEYAIDVNNSEGNAANVGDGDPLHLKGYRIITSGTQTTNDASYTVDPAADGSSLSISISATSRACFKAGIGDVQETVNMNWGLIGPAAAFGDPTAISLAVGGTATALAIEEIATAANYAAAASTINQKPASASVAVEIFLRSKDAIVDTGQIEKRFFITTRSLCCCKERKDKQSEGVVYEPIQTIPGTVGTIADEHKIRSAMRQEMIGSLVSSRRTTPKSFPKTQLAFDLVLPILLKDTAARATLTESAAHVLPESLGKRATKGFREALKHVSRLQLLGTHASLLSGATGLDDDAIHELKTAMLRKSAAPKAVSKHVEQLRAARRTTAKKQNKKRK